MYRRSGSKGSSARRGFAARAARTSRPAAAAAPRSAVSVGSPVAWARASSAGLASLQSTPATRSCRRSDRRAVGGSPRRAKVGAPPTASASSYSPRGVHSARAVISFRVRVPVLSEQTTVVLPNASTAGRRRTIARRRAIRLTPTARAIVMIAGMPSGMAATARLIAASIASTKG